MLTVGQLIAELEEMDRTANATVEGREIINVETTNDGCVLIEGEQDVE